MPARRQAGRAPAGRTESRGRPLAAVRRAQFHARRRDLRDVLACEDDGICGAAAEQTLLDRLHVKRGDLIKLGNATFRVMAVLEQRARPHLHRLFAGAARADFHPARWPAPVWCSPAA